jgi:hypothetical protein
MNPRSIFRCRRHRPAYLSRVVEAASKARLIPRTLTEARIWHRADFRYPRGPGACVCQASEIHVELIPWTPKPERN